jgi:site-specific recombinase XerD
MEEDLKLAGYSPRTVGSYLGAASRFLRHVDKPASKLTRGDVRKYFLYLADEKGAAASTINQAHFGVRFLIRDVLDKPWRQKLRLHKRPQRLPVVLSREEIGRLLLATENTRDRTIWMTLYAAGLRVSEAVQLQVGDIDSEEMRLLVRNGKGRKDRYTLLSDGLLQQLRSYWKQYRSPKWLFFGRDPHKPLLTRTVQRAFQEDKQRARIQRNATPHSLRHAFATHLMENGANLLYIKDLLGHRALKSTLVYLKITRDGLQRPENPLDQLLEAHPKLAH